MRGERTYESKYNMTVEQNIFVAKRNIVDYIWKSAKLEGLAVTFPDTDAIVNGMSVHGVSVDDILTINNIKHAWMFLFDTVDVSVNHAYICKINQIIGSGNLIYNAGFVRSVPVTVGGTDWKPDMPIESCIKEEFERISSIELPTERAITAMLWIMRRQMFLDGNKRTAMMVGNKIMIENGAGIISVPLERLPDFGRLLIGFYETNDMTAVMDFVYDCCIDGLELEKDLPCATDIDEPDIDATDHDEPDER